VVDQGYRLHGPSAALRPGAVQPRSAPQSGPGAGRRLRRRARRQGSARGLESPRDSSAVLQDLLNVTYRRGVAAV